MNRGWLVGVGLLLMCSGAAADDDHLQAKRLQKAGDIVAVEIILNKVREQYHGRVLEVELEKKGGRYLYEIEVVDETGEVLELYFDAKSGEPVSDKWLD